eukprot:1136527-Pelagomonas_calceolata.AAC.1
MAAGYGNDCTINSTLDTPRAAGCCFRLLRWGFQRRYMALYMRSSSTEPDTITITSFASLTHNRWHAP